jgi:hypothetical protein
LWLWWRGPVGTAPDLDLIWRSYVRRFDLEHTFRFLKQNMGWTTPRVRHPEQADRWSWLIVTAYTQLRLARARVADLRLPWERRHDAGRLLRILQNTNRAELRIRALLSEECAARLDNESLAMEYNHTRSHFSQPTVYRDLSIGCERPQLPR